MSPFLYALNIGTFATWLTVAGASTVACVIHVSEHLPELVSMQQLTDLDASAEVNLGDLAMGSAPPADPTEEISEESTPQEQIAQADPTEVPEDLPEIPEIAEMEPLPEIPDFPEPAPEQPKAVAPKTETAPKPRPAVARQATGNARESAPGAKKATSNGESGNGTGRGNGTTPGSGSGVIGQARWAGGRTPSPRYPSEARRNNQMGRVIVSFSVDEAGNVVQASIKDGCSYPLLNEEALRCVRTWKFPPGPRASATNPIVFRLN